MKRLFLITLFFLPIVSFAFTVPAKPTGFVRDYAGMLSADEVSQLETKLENFERQTTNEIAVVTVPSLESISPPAGNSIENAAQDMFTRLGIGKKDKNNGVLLFISLADHKTRIQTGYGVEGDLTEITTSYIQSDIIAPAFRNGDYFGGSNGAVDKMIESLSGGDVVPLDYSMQSANTTRSFNLPWQIIFFLVYVAFLLLGDWLGRSKSWWFGGVLGAGLGTFLIWFFAITSIFYMCILVFLPVFLGLLFDHTVSSRDRAKDIFKKTGRYPWCGLVRWLPGKVHFYSVKPVFVLIIFYQCRLRLAHRKKQRVCIGRHFCFCGHCSKMILVVCVCVTDVMNFCNDVFTFTVAFFVKHFYFAP